MPDYEISASGPPSP